jgi:asparagine synthase (glutamine-hydrolysing)
MCGIAGIVNLAGAAPVPQGPLQNMALALFHRGPDEDGFLRQPGIGLASRRLSIVGLLDGRQPLSNEDHSVSVVYNGELFDYPETRAWLRDRGHRLRTHCDTEILPHLWEEHGEAMLARLRGQFALALWDHRQRRLVLARDRFGICPLYWTRQGDWLLFASEIKALLASGLVDAEPDPRGINQAFTFFAIPGPASCFKGVNILQPGHYLVVEPASAGAAPRVADRIFWQVDFPDRGGERTGDAKQLTDEFEAVLTKSVERRLRADVPVVSYLSGGVDSSLVVALATRLRKDSGAPPIPTFTIRVTAPGLDEASEANQVARHIGARPVVVDCGAREVMDTYPELIRAAEGPVMDTACASLLMLAREVHQQGYKVAMTGEGADEWLAGYPWFKIHRLLSWLDVIPGVPLSNLARRAYLVATGGPRMPWATVQRTLDAVGGQNAWLDLYGMYSTAKLRLFSRQMWERLGDHSPYGDLGLNLDRMKRWHPFNRSLSLGARIMLPGLLLASKGDRVAMNSSVETRYPFLDEDLFDFLAPLHPRWKLRGLRDKYLLRLVAQRWLPRQIAWRRKAMFRAPLDGFHDTGTGLPPYVEQLLSEESLRRTGYFDPAAVAHWRRAFRGLRAGSNQRTMIELALVGVVSTQLWHHTYIDASLADLPAWQAPRRELALAAG